MCTPWSLCDSWAPSYCDMHSERVACAGWRWRCHWDSQAACACVGDGAAVAICSQDVVPCHVGRVLSFRAVSRHVISGHVILRCYAVSCRVMSSHVASCHLCHVMSCHAVLCRVTSRPVALRCVAARKAATTHDTAIYLTLTLRKGTPLTLTELMFIYHSRSHSLHSHRSHLCARVVLSTSHSF